MSLKSRRNVGGSCSCDGLGRCPLSERSSRVDATDSPLTGERKRWARRWISEAARRWISEAVRTLPRAAPSMPWATSRAAPASNWHSFGVFPWSEPSNDLHAWVASPGSRRATDRIRTGVRCRRAKRERLLVTPVRKRCPSWIAYRPGPSQSRQANSNSSGVAIQRMSFTITEQNRASTLLTRCLARGRSVAALWLLLQISAIGDRRRRSKS